MRSRNLACLVGVAAALLVGGCGQADDSGAPAGDPSEPAALDEIGTLVAGKNRFALDLYARLRAERPGNLFFSPYSISTALGMTWAGARGQTAEEMANVLHFDLPGGRVHAGFAALAGQLAEVGAQEGCRLDVANRLWGQQGQPFLPDFLSLTEESYGAELAQVDFESDPEAVRSEINAWIEKHTGEKIRDLVPPGGLGAETTLVLTSAIYFKGRWATPFLEGRTHKATFHVAADREVEIAMMYDRGMFWHAASDGLHLLKLPYAGHRLSMIVLLPNKVDGLADVEKNLSMENLDRWLSALGSREVQVWLPRFSMTSAFQLNDVLAAMGMKRAFAHADADFSGVNGKRDLFLSDVIHRTFLEVTEEGTEAAAATEVEEKPKDLLEELLRPVEFRADHPFLLLIREDRTGAILFLGRVTNPAE